MTRGTGLISGLTVTVLFLLSGSVNADVRFQRKFLSDHLLNPLSGTESYGLTSVIWPDSTTVDTTAATIADTTSDTTSTIDIDLNLQPDDSSSIVDKLDYLEPADSVATGDPKSPQKLDPPITITKHRSYSGDAAADDGTAIGSASISGSTGDAGSISKPFYGDLANAGVEIEEDDEPVIHRHTIVQFAGLPASAKTQYDTATGYVVIDGRLSGSSLPISGALDKDAYLRHSIINADRAGWHASIMKKLPTEADVEDGPIHISIPVFKSRSARRIFGGSDIGLSVSGNIRVDGSLRMENRDTQQQDTPNETSYQFKMDQSQRFVIKGKVGEKVSVEIDQDSERLFEFENNIRIRYKGEEDEIIKSIEAGNVSMSLGGASLASVSTRHEGLFGFKTESKIGALELTTITSLKKGESQAINIDGGAQEGKPIDIRPREFVWRRFYFLDEKYRENFRHRGPDLLPIAAPEQDRIVQYEVYKSVNISSGANYNAVHAWALADPSDTTDYQNRGGDPDVEATFYKRLLPDTDYYMFKNQGYIRLNMPLSQGEVLAVAYITTTDSIGDINPPPPNDDETPFFLKLLQPKSPSPENVTWNLMWRNVYNLGAANIDKEGFEGKINRIIGARRSEIDEEHPENKSYLEIFGLDHGGDGTSEPDGSIDEQFINYTTAELTFPDLQPFDPVGWFKGNIEIKTDQDSALFSPLLYTERISEMRNITSNFEIEVQYKSVSASYSLGFNVLDGSVEVLMNGSRLSEGIDYTMDYLSGDLTLLRQEALSPTAAIEIKYETGELFQTDTETLLGVRAEYELWEQSSIGLTFAYYNEKKRDRRVRVGGEPTRNTVWDLNTRLHFKPYFLTQAVDWLPFIETDKPSTFTINGEIAQVYPDPNSLNSPSTGDYNGVAYIDDFESIKRTTPLGITLVLWRHSSFPAYGERGEGRWLPQRGRMIWYNPLNQVNIRDIWPDREVEAQASTIPVLQLEFQPWWTEWGVRTPPPNIDPSKSWGGVMRYLGTGYADQSRSKYLEIWLRRVINQSDGIMYIDLGRISEDVIPDSKLNTEDLRTESFPFGDGILSDHEDVGFDQIAGEDPADSSYINNDQELLPSYDDWQPFTSRDYLHINGTEGSKGFESGRYPDTEDLDNDGGVDLANDFFRYRIDLHDPDSPYIVGGRFDGWRLYRIPLTENLPVGKPAFTEIEAARIWFTGFNSSSSIMIAQIEIVGNEWQEVKAKDEQDKEYDPISIAVINTHDNRGEYITPPGVSGERDPTTNLQSREQSLAIKINRLFTGETGMVYKQLPSRQSMDVLEYRQMKMFVHGGDKDTTLTDRFGRNLDLELFLRFGSDSSSANPHYYEYSQRLQPGWTGNDIYIDFERLTSLKFLRIQDSTRNYDILPNGAVIRVMGEPTLGNIKFFIIGIKNHGPEIIPADKIELWCDELRVSDVIRNPGWAAKGSAKLSLADFISLSTSITQNQADFHRIEQRIGSRKDNLSGNFSSSIKMDHFFDPNLGLRIPLSFKYSQSIAVPRYIQTGDVKLSALTDERIDIWTKFREDIFANDRFRGHLDYQTELESEITAKKSYAFSTNISKSKKFENPLLRYTLDGIRLKGSYREDFGASPSRLYDNGRRAEGGISYDLSIDNPLELNWMAWTQNIPVLNRVSESALKPFPSSFSVASSGTESISKFASRPKYGGKSGITERYSFNISRNYRIGFRPISVLSFDLSQALAGTRIRDDSLRTLYASDFVELDPDDYGDSASFDQENWDKDYLAELERIKHDIYWKAFGGYFVDNDFKQDFNTSFSPDLVSWLGTEASYRSNYSWYWDLSSGTRRVGARGAFSASMTFRLQQILSNLTSKSDGRKKTKSQVDEAPPWLQDEFRANLPGGGGSPADDPANLSPIDPNAEQPPDETPALSDTTAEKRRPPPRPQDILIPIRDLFARLKDIRWSFSKTDDFTNHSVGTGQADWLYRLALTGDPGLGKVAGVVFEDAITKSWNHTLSSGLEITDNLSISSFDYKFGQTKNTRGGQSGTSKSTVFQTFKKDKITVNAIPFVNYSLRWSGWEDLPVLSRFSKSVSLDHSFRGNKSESWRKSEIDTKRQIDRLDYERAFSPLLGVSFSWKGGVGSNIRYNVNQRVSDASTGAKTLSMDESRTMSFSANYTSNRGIKIPIPIWPFSGRRLKNKTTFSLTYDNSLTLQKNSSDGNPFEESSKTKSWSFKPSMEYSFSNTVRGGVHYEYAVQDSKRSGKSKSHDFGFSVNISIRG